MPGRPMTLTAALLLAAALAGCEDPRNRANSEPCTDDNQCETGICHRGICGANSPAGVGNPCAGHGDCQSFLCALGTCERGTGAAGSACLNHEECASSSCVGGACAAGVGLPGGEKCATSAQCASKVCHGGVCMATGPADNGGCCGGGWECKSFNCQGGICAAGKGTTGGSCFHHQQCLSGFCQLGRCAASPCPVSPDAGSPDAAPLDAGPQDLGAADQTASVDQAVLPDQAVADATGSVPMDLPSPPPDSAVGPVVKWGITSSAGGTLGDRGAAIAVDSAGNSYITGLFMGSASFGGYALTASNTRTDLFVAKLNANNTWGWANSGGSSLEHDNGFDLTLAPGGHLHLAGHLMHQASFGTFNVTAQGGTDALVARVSPLGVFSWVTPLGGTSNDLAQGIAVDSSGNSYVAGHFGGTATFGTIQATSKGGTDIFVAKLDSAGKVLWVRTAGSTGPDFARRVRLGSGGELTLTGSFGGAITFGSTSLTHAGNGDVYVARMSSAGAWTWAVSAGGAGADTSYGLALDSAGNATITGQFSGVATFGPTKLTSQGKGDIHVARVDNTGKIAWALPAGGAGDDDWGRGVACTASGVCYVVGAFTNIASFGPSKVTSRGNTDVFIAKLTAAGAFAWGASAGGTGYESAYDVALSSTGKIHVTGDFGGTADFGGQILSAAGLFDVFVTVLPAQ